MSTTGEQFEDLPGSHAHALVGELAERDFARTRRMQVRMRILGHLLGGVALLMSASVGPNRYAIAALVLGALTPLMILIARTRGPVALALWGSLIDMFAIVTLLHLSPRLYTVAAILALVSLLPVARASYLWWTSVAGLGLVGFAVVGLIHQPPLGLATFAGFAVAIPAIRRNSHLSARREVALAKNLDHLMTTACAAFWEIDIKTGQLDHAFGQVYELTGYLHDELIGGPKLRLHPDSLPSFAPEVLSDMEIGLQRNQRIRFRHRDGHWVAVQEFSRIEISETGHRVLRGVWFDVSEMDAARSALTRYLDIVESLRSAVLLVGRQDGYSTSPLAIFEANEAAAAVLNVDPGEIVGNRLEDALSWTGPSGLARAANLVANGTSESESLKALSIGNHRHDRQVDVDVLGLPGGLLALIVTDVTDAMASERIIRHQAEHDSLTGLANRSRFNRKLEQALADPTAGSLCLFLLDLDRFKEVNDTLGHAAGDLLLETVAQRLVRVAGPEVLVARLGGDEFALLLTGDADADTIAAFAERISEACRRPVALGELTVPVGASIGIVLAPEHGDKAGLLMRRVDIAMYAAKRAGTDYRIYEESGERKLADRLSLTSELASAFDNNEIELWFQPKIRLSTGEISGVEGLVRWRHPSRGLLSPGDFLELIELAGYRQHLNRLVLEQGIRFGSHCARAGSPVTVAVNLSALSFLDMDLSRHVFELLSRYDLPADRLLLEVTEQDVMEDLDSGSSVSLALGEMGVRLSIDDFGTGYSSFARLRELPVSELKIDRSFIGGLPESHEDAIIVKSIIDLAANLGLQSVAEGVERQETSTYLTSIGCDRGQGYYYAVPLDPARALATVCTSRVVPDHATVRLDAERQSDLDNSFLDQADPPAPSSSATARSQSANSPAARSLAS